MPIKTSLASKLVGSSADPAVGAAGATWACTGGGGEAAGTGDGGADGSLACSSPRPSSYSSITVPFSSVIGSNAIGVLLAFCLKTHEDSSAHARAVFDVQG